MSRLEVKSCAFTIKSIEDDQEGDGSIFTGDAAIFHSVDEGYDLISAHAYDKSIDSFRQNGVIRLEHEVSVGKVIDAGITSRGLTIKGKISNTSVGRDAKVLLKDGVLKRLSIGQYITSKRWLDSPDEVKAVWDREGYKPSEDDLMKAGGGVRLIESANPVETSLVFNPMQRLATITSVKTDGQHIGLSFADHSDSALASLEEYSERAEAVFAKRAESGRTLGPERIASFKRLSDRLLRLLEASTEKPVDTKTAEPPDASADTDLDTKGAVPFVAAPVVDKAWDAAGARKRLKAWASSDGSGDKDKIDWAKYAKGFAYVRSE